MPDLRSLFRRFRPAEVASAHPTALTVAALGARQAFDAYNRRRRARLEAQVGPRLSQALDLLPLLLHGNEPGLPGSVEDPACPVGIAGYSPAAADLQLLRRRFPAARGKRAGVLRPALDLVAAMGSAGTIGFAEDSDLDLWLCHSDALAEPRLLALYREKVRGVEAWLNTQGGRKIHLFLQPTDHIRANDFGQTDVEGCGSALGALLKEEFYRTAVVLAGLTPAWWAVPPGVDPEGHDAHLAALAADPCFPAAEFLDLGWVARVPLGELFGAAIWQIVKGWTAPFKAALKMGLLEKMVAAGPGSQALCEVLKAQVLRGEEPDPYCLLFDEVLTHYRIGGDREAQDLLARCFYLKAGARLHPETLGRPPPPGSPEAVLAAYAREWDWGPRQVQHLNDFDRWRHEWAQDLAKELNRFFLRTYQRLREALDASGEAQRITARDRTILGRKLQAMYRKVPYKVETLHLVDSGREEANLALVQTALPSGGLQWQLGRGHLGPTADDRPEESLGASLDPVALLTWATHNRVLGARTHLTGRGLERELSAPELEALAHHLAAFCQAEAAATHPLSCLLEAPRLVRLLVVPNFGLDGDALRELTAVYATTWGETFCRSWVGVDAFRSFAREVFAPSLEAGCGAPEVFSPARRVGGFKGPHRRLGRELPALVGFLGAPPSGPRRRRAVLLDGSGYTALERVGTGATAVQELPDGDALERYLGAVGPHELVETRIESQSGPLAILKTVFEAATPGLVDVFALSVAEEGRLYVVDEVGNLSILRHSREPNPYALARLVGFLENVFPEVAAQPASPLAGRTLGECLRIHTLLYDGTCSAYAATQEHLARVAALGLRPVGLTMERAGGAPGAYRVRWGDQVFQTGQVENPLAEVRRRIRAARQSGLEYDPFVTRLFLDEHFRTERCGAFAALGHYLFYRQALEAHLAR